jgi:hypothetical protein
MCFRARSGGMLWFLEGIDPCGAVFFMGCTRLITHFHAYDVDLMVLNSDEKSENRSRERFQVNNVWT